MKLKMKKPSTWEVIFAAMVLTLSVTLLKTENALSETEQKNSVQQDIIETQIETINRLRIDSTAFEINMRNLMAELNYAKIDIQYYENKNK